MSYSIAANYQNELFFECAQRAVSRPNNECVGRFVTVRDGDGNLNMEFYEARARRARSEAFASIASSIAAFFRG